MALSWLEGFESYGTASGETLDAALIAQGYSYANLYYITTARGQLVDGTFHGKALQWFTMSTSPYLRKSIPNTSTFIIGFAFKHSGLTRYYTSHRLLEFVHPNGNTQCSLWMYSDGTLCFYRGTSTYLTKLPNPLSSNTWYYVEIKICISNASGYIIVRVNGSEVLNITSLDTQNELTSDISAIDFLAVTYTCFDDMYFCDDTGGDPSFLGPLTIENLQPTSDSVIGWDIVGGVNHYDAVDNQPADDASYVVGDTLNEYDLYGYGNLQIIDTGIIGVAQTTRICTNNAGVRKLKTLCYSGSTLETTSELVFSGVTEFEPVDAILIMDPDTSVAWTPSGLNNATFGVRVGD